MSRRGFESTHRIALVKPAEGEAEEDSTCNTGGMGSCGSTCTGADTCSFVAKMPKRYSLPSGTKKGQGG
jgi:hypothetical protein